MQIVVSGNRVLAHGENFLAMGGTVVNTETGKVYQNATVVECENCPADIDKVGYEYHAGVFVPCAPYGVGLGNIAVVCNEDCKSIKDSGYDVRILNNVAHVVTGSYTGSGKYGESNPNTLTFDTIPKLVVIVGTGGGYIIPQRGVGIVNNFITGISNNTITVSTSGNTISWHSNAGAKEQLSQSGSEYAYVAFY